MLKCDSDAVSSLNLQQFARRNFLMSTDFSLNSIFQNIPLNLTNGSSTLTTTNEDFGGTSAMLIPTATLTARNSSKTLKCPKCNWHYKYQETLEIHMKEKHAESEVKCVYCLQNRPHPRLARGESYSCGYKPYRCEICKYSTTTKGNLSIHMQSDKHLHAVQEMPSIVSGTSSMSTKEIDLDSVLQCLVCSAFFTDSTAEMLAHIEKDRNRPVPGDISVIHGTYQCNLCPYSTSLKANFQLHTRTDKHIQRVQMMNHLREGGNTGTTSAICRLNTVKGVVQVRCRPCQEILSCPTTLREHCESRVHATRLAQLSVLVNSTALSSSSTSSSSSQPSPIMLFECRQCSFETTNKNKAIEHMQCHENNFAESQTADESDRVQSDSGVIEDDLEKDWLLDVNEMSEAIFYCTNCDFTTKTKIRLENHTKTVHKAICGQRDDVNSADDNSGTIDDGDDDDDVRNDPNVIVNNIGDANHDSDSTEQCPLCPDKSKQLRHHLSEDHKIAQDAIERLLLLAVPSPSSTNDSASTNYLGKTISKAATWTTSNNDRLIYCHRCKYCSLAFRTEHRLACHLLYHAFRASTRCSQCDRNFRSIEHLRKHVTSEHTNGKFNLHLPSTSVRDSENDDNGKELTDPADDGVNDLLRPYKCDLCSEYFDLKHSLIIHYNSVNHLHQAKKILEQQPNNFKTSAQVIAALQASTQLSLQQNNLQSRPFKCNLCKHSFGQGSTLDIHIRSVAHQSRLSKINELVAQGELDSLKPLIEQPGSSMQLTIGEMLNRDDMEQNGIEQQSTLAMMNIFNMAQFLAMTPSGSYHLNPAAAPTTLPSLPPPLSSTTPAVAMDPVDLIHHEPNTLNNVVNAFPNGITPQFDVLGQLANIIDANIGFEPQLCTDEDRIPRSGVAFRKMLEKYGVDVVMQYNECAEQRKRKLDALPNDIVNELSQTECSKCRKTFSSIWILKTHYEEVHKCAVPADEVEKFAFKLRKVLDNINGKENVNQPESSSRKRSSQESGIEGSEDLSLGNSLEEKLKLEVKKTKEETISFSASSTPRPSTSKDNANLSSQIAMMGMLGFPFIANPFMSVMSPDFFTNPLFTSQQNSNNISNMLPCMSPAKRARTRITDEQLKILRQYFDINNSPSEQQIKEMSVKAQLPEKVIKHWFRNTLFKERQRDKDSPYNFSVPPQMSIDLDTYEKTGEAKITSIKTAETSTEDLKPAHILVTSESSNNVPQSLGSTSSQLSSLRTSPVLSNPFAAFLHDDKSLHSMIPGLSTSSSASGRRANRTRFTDYQLKTLQQFFDKQAYPKDDDLEILSKKLQLSPRVIVVWFQNARQKARKIYENQPAMTSDDRFMKTPGSNFQCKRCQLVFQRYYELIQHQQKLCYKDDCSAQQKDNKAVEENLSDDEKCLMDIENRDLSLLNAISTNNQANIGALAQLIGSASSDASSDIHRAEFLKLLATHQDATLKLKVREKKKAFYKRCPFCCLLFHSRESLISHIPSRHPEQSNSTSVDVDRLPDAEDVPTITTVASDDGDSSKISGSAKKSEYIPLDLSCTTSGEVCDDSLSVSPSYYQSDNDNDDNSDNAETCEQYINASPNHCSSLKVNQTNSPSNSKRYRTHLTPMQVHVMKSIFMDYKTPSMTECDALGNEIGLHKRVVQVWFQNARAKERKTRAYSGEDDLPKSTASQCTLCSIEYNHRLTMHDHIFTADHINKVKRLLRSDGQSTAEINREDELVENNNKYENYRTRMKAVRDRKVVKTTSTQNFQSIADIAHSSFPYNLVYGLQPGLAPIIYDPNVMGTPIPLLQVPDTVMAQITNDLSLGNQSTKFTQDGKAFQQLVAILPFRDFQCAASKDTEVGWACPQCTNVFQQELMLANHQRLICPNVDSVFKLIQSHYECRACNAKFGTQIEFKSHCESSDHQHAREVFLAGSS